MEIEGIIFLAVWVVLASLILFTLFTKKGRKKAIEVQFGAKVKTDLGILSEEPILLGKQTIRLFECEKEGEHFLVLEVKRSAGIGFTLTYVKLDEAVMNKLNSYIRAK